MAKADLTAEKLRKLLHYDPETGVFTHITGHNRRSAGALAGSLNGLGYITIGIGGKSLYAHRLAWLWATGEWPTHSIDHMDGNRANNAFANLRDVPHSSNMQNRRRNNKNCRSGWLGVGITPKGRFIAHLTHAGKSVHLGTFDTPEEAHKSYIEGKRLLHTGNTL